MRACLITGIFAAPSFESFFGLINHASAPLFFAIFLNSEGHLKIQYC